ncbi:MAG: hypothetical protein H8D23_04990 [Candidatus Brocadiales bacterium]|nr:hypothetical protein [Candidatus Brocadiales bacterium]
MENLLSNASGLAVALSGASFTIGGTFGNPQCPDGVYSGKIIEVDHSESVVKSETSTRKGQKYVKVTLLVESEDHQMFNVSDGRYDTGLSLEETEKQIEELSKDYIEGRTLRFKVVNDGNFINASLVKFAEK